MTAPICPCCGYNLEAEMPIVAGRFSYSPGRGFMVDGERMPMQPACHLMLGAVMAADGQTVRKEALANRQNEESHNLTNLVSVYVHFLRRAFQAAGIAVPFERVPCIGLRWTGPPVERLAA